MTHHYYQSATADYFPDVMPGFKMKANANDNVPQQVEVSDDPIINIMNAVDQMNQSIKTMIECIQLHHEVLGDNDQRLANLEEILGE